MGNTLDRSRAVAKDRKQQLPALAQVIEPPLQGDRLALVLADRGDGGNRRLGRIGRGNGGFFGS